MKTIMLKRYELQFLLRLVIFLTVFYFYITDKDAMYSMVITPIWMGISPVHILWIIFMFIMLQHIFPHDKLSMAARKANEQKYVPEENYSELDLLRFVRRQNIRAWKVMLVWLIFNACFAALYLFDVINEADMFMLTVFYFLSDYICILFFCPFQTFLMKNRCCVNCRIFDWGHFMMFTPMLFVKNFFSWSLFFTSCVVLIRWEIVYSRHPERFWYGSNKNLQCVNCKDKLCRYKKKILGEQITDEIGG